VSDQAQNQEPRRLLQNGSVQRLASQGYRRAEVARPTQTSQQLLFQS
jgi:hypothetical protein